MKKIRPVAGRAIHRRRTLGLEPLEHRQLLATLAGHWIANDLTPSHASESTISVWHDAVSGIAALAEGSPTLVRDALNGNAVVRFDAAGDGDAFLVAAAQSPMSGADDFSIAVVFATNQPGEPTPLFTETFDSFTAPAGNFNGLQYQSGLPVAFGGDVAGWSKTGGNPVHAVDTTRVTPPELQDYAVLMWQDNVITLNSAIAGSNSSGQTYTVEYLGSAAVYQAASQVTGPSDGLLIDVLRSNGSILTTHTYLPGAWGGDLTLAPHSFQYTGDGSGDIRLRVRTVNATSGRFGGAIDSLSVTGASELFADDFDDFTAPAANFNGLQYQSGLPVAFGGDLPGWSKSGGGVVHAVNHAELPPPPPSDYAAMMWQDNVLTQNQPIIDSNTAGQHYRIDFLASPAVYQAASQQTSPTDGIAVEVLRADNSVLARHVHLPGAWQGNIELTAGQFEYVGDGTGDIRLRIGPSAFNSGRFGGAIDDVVVSALPRTSDGDGTGPWFTETGILDANQGGLGNDWGIALTNAGQIAAGVGNPEVTQVSSGPNLRNGEPHVVIMSQSNDTLALSVDGVVVTLPSTSNSVPRDLSDMAIGRLLSGQNFFTGDIAEIRIYHGVLTASEVSTLTTVLRDSYFNDPPVAVDDTYAAQEDVELAVTVGHGVLANDVDDEGRLLRAVWVSGPDHGILDLRADGSFDYRPRNNFSGIDSFEYRVTDGEKESETARVEIRVTAVVDAPQTLADSYFLAPDQTSTFAPLQGVLANDFHPDGTSFSANLVDNVTHGVLNFQSDGSFTYAPQANFTGTDRFTYRANDGTAMSELTEVELIVLTEPVIISEFMASNETYRPTRVRAAPTISYTGGQRYFDWIELKNLSSNSLDIGGWHLTDRNGNRRRWEIPAGTSIPASGFLTIFASGLDIRDPSLDERGSLHTDFALDASGGVLALTSAGGSILHGYTSDYPVQFTNLSYGLANGTVPGYFSTPTPNAGNPTTFTTNGPLVTRVTENPGPLQDSADLIITADVQARSAAIDHVELVYRVMFEPEQSVAMRDDGGGADLVAGDGTYTAVIPRSVAAPGEMLRWKVIARDARDNSTQSPLALDITGERRSPEYFGTMIDDPAIDTQLPDFHWYIQTPSAADNETGTRASVYYLGEFYDNVLVRSRGASAQSVNKKSYKFEFNVGHDFRYDSQEPRVTEINLNATFQDKAYIRAMLTFQSYADAGVPASDSFLMRIEQNGQFFSVANFVEQIDEDFLEKRGLDPDGALYKMFNGVTSSTSGVEKKTREYEANTDLQALVAGIRASNPNRAQYLFDNIDIPAMISYATAGIISQDFDRWAKNFYLYRDTNGTGEWTQLPHDKDLTFGKRFFDDEISGDGFMFESNLSPAQHRAHPFQGASQHACCGQPNWMIDLLVTNPRTREMYLRRLRTLMDEQLQPPGTPVEDRHFEATVDRLAAVVAPDAALDLAKWGAIFGIVRDFPTAIQLLKTNYLDERRVYLYQTHGVGGAPNSVGIPDAQQGHPQLVFGQIEFDPSSGNQDQEFIELQNPHNFAVDLSGWRLQGTIDYEFKPGTVLPAGDKIYVSPNVPAFRARSTGPRGGQQLFVQGGHGLHLANSGGTLELVAADGTTIATTSYVGNVPPVDAFLRISEIHYNPADPSDAEVAAGHTDNDDFEFIEIMNIGAIPISITDARLGVIVGGNGEEEGVVFNFADGQITALGPGERAVVVEDLDAFRFRYGDDVPVAGQWVGGLNNAGETITLIGSNVIHQVEYDDGALWPASADGVGTSLELIAQSDVTRLDKHYSWAASSDFGGTPGRVNSQPLGVVINEVRTNTDNHHGRSDAIELYNTTDLPIALGGWFLSDSDRELLKFQIPLGTVLPAHGFMVFDEDDFNGDPSAPTSFALNGSAGDSVWLVVPDARGGVAQFVDDVRFGASLVGETFGRVPDGAGRLTPLARESLGCRNGDGRTGQIAITEFNYNPGEPSPASLTIAPDLTEDDLEFLEIHNPTLQTVDISSWQLRGGVQYEFPAGTQLLPGETLLVLSFDPSSAANANRTSAFRTHYDITPSIRLLGGFAGQISDSGEELRLERSVPQVVDGVTILSLIVEDRVLYDDLSPWPVEADGSGVTLQRHSVLRFGSDVTAWEATDPTPGIAPILVDIPGDFTGDGAVDGSDIDRMYDHLRRNNQLAALDLDGNARVNRADLDFLVRQVLDTQYGDITLDGQVDAADFNVWNTHKFVTCGAGWSEGDLSGDGYVDGTDFNVWNQYKFRSVGVAAAAPIATRSPRAAATAATIDRPAEVIDAAFSEWNALRSHHQRMLNRRDSKVTAARATLPWEGRAPARGGTTECRSSLDSATPVGSAQHRIWKPCWRGL